MLHKYFLYGILAPALMLAGLLFFAGSAFAADTLLTSTYIDADDDGTVDHLKWTFDANITACAFEAGDWSIDEAGTIGITSIDGINTADPEGTGDGACDGTDAVIYIEVTASANVTGGAVNPEVSYTNQGTADSLEDGAAITDKADVANTDAAAPVVVSVSPASVGNVTSDIVITFSEPMNTDFDENTEFSVTPDPGAFTDVWSVGNTVVTLDAPALSCGVTYAVLLDDGEIDAAAGTPSALLTTGPHDGDWSFVVVCGSSGGGPTIVEAAVDITNVAVVGNAATINWTAQGTGVSYVNLYYIHNGATTLIQSNVQAGAGAYVWAMPAMLSGSVQIKIEATDLAEVLATDTSAAFMVGDGEAEEMPADEEEEEVNEEAVVPVAGVSPGDLIKSASDSAVYYVTVTYGRRVFMDVQTFFTWNDDFSDVRVVSDATLSALDLEGIMLPKHGVVLVKIVSDPRVYALADGGFYTPALRAIDSESVAIDIYGSAWADYVIDVDPTFFSKFATGPTVHAEGDIEVNLGAMKKRSELR